MHENEFLGDFQLIQLTSVKLLFKKNSIEMLVKRNFLVAFAKAKNPKNNGRKELDRPHQMSDSLQELCRPTVLVGLFSIRLTIFHHSSDEFSIFSFNFELVLKSFYCSFSV